MQSYNNIYSNYIKSYLYVKMKEKVNDLSSLFP